MESLHNQNIVVGSILSKRYVSTGRTHCGSGLRFLRKLLVQVFIAVLQWTWLVILFQGQQTSVHLRYSELFGRAVLAPVDTFLAHVSAWALTLSQVKGLLHALIADSRVFIIGVLKRAFFAFARLIKTQLAYCVAFMSIVLSRSRLVLLVSQLCEVSLVSKAHCCSFGLEYLVGNTLVLDWYLLPKLGSARWNVETTILAHRILEIYKVVIISLR